MMCVKVSKGVGESHDRFLGYHFLSADLIYSVQCKMHSVTSRHLQESNSQCWKAALMHIRPQTWLCFACNSVDLNVNNQCLIMTALEQHFCISDWIENSSSSLCVREVQSLAAPAVRTSAPERVAWRQLATWWSWASPTCVWSEATAVWLEPMSSGLSGADCWPTSSKLVNRQT